MSTTELGKVEIIGQVAQKFLTQQQAANIFNICSRRVRRLLQKYRDDGASALISKKREQPSNHQISPCV